MCIILFDLKSAFDTVNRTALIRKMHQRGLSAPLVNAIADLLSNTSHYLQNEDFTYSTNTGVPQGARTSPALFNFYIDDLLHLLQPIDKRSTFQKVCPETVATKP